MIMNPFFEGLEKREDTAEDEELENMQQSDNSS